jgi:hypothetical protein
MTAQESDVIQYKGERVPLFSNPLESFWDENHPRPQFVTTSTANWRGYVATWVILNEVLHLESISGGCIVDGAGNVIVGRTPFMQQRITDGIPGDRATIPASIERLFPGSHGSVPATWFTGTLRIPRGRLLYDEDMGYVSTYEEEILLEVQQGRVISTDVVDNRREP